MALLEDLVFKETGWELLRAQGEVPSATFFKMLSEKKFPIVYELRGLNSLYASAEPDLWHEVFGHIPFLWSPKMTEIYQQIGEAAYRALHQGDQAKFAIIAKLYWFYCEYGLVEETGRNKMMGAGIIASPMGPFKLQGHGNVSIFSADRRSFIEQELNPYSFQSTLFRFKALDFSAIAGYIGAQGAPHSNL